MPLDTKQKVIVGGVAVAGLAGLAYAFKNSSAGSAVPNTSQLSPTSGMVTAGTVYIPTTSYDVNNVYGTQTTSNTTTANTTSSTQVGTSIASGASATIAGSSTTGSLAAAANAPAATALGAGNVTSSNNGSSNTTTATTTNSPGATTISDPKPWRTIPAPTPKPAPKPVPKPAPVSKPKPAPNPYTVRPGDSLWAIAEAKTGNGANWTKIYANTQNRNTIGSNPNLIHPGQKLVLPF